MLESLESCFQIIIKAYDCYLILAKEIILNFIKNFKKVKELNSAKFWTSEVLQIMSLGWEWKVKVSQVCDQNGAGCPRMTKVALFALCDLAGNLVNIKNGTPSIDLHFLLGKTGQD